MPTKTGAMRPRAGHGLSSAIDTSSAAAITKPASAKVARNRNRVTSTKPRAVAGKRHKK